MSVSIVVGDCREILRTLPEKSIQTCVTSPPYFGLRYYGVDGQIGLEQTPGEYVAEMVGVFREVRRVLRDDGTLWLNLGDSYGKAKQLLGIPWQVAFALQADGWYLRSSIIWHKPNPMPESATDRPSNTHENIFLLAKSEHYFYDADAVREEATWKRENNPEWQKQRAKTNAQKGAGNRNAADGGFTQWSPDQGRNLRNVWTVATMPFAGAHFATFPPELIGPCIKAGCPQGGKVLDPFGGAGTTGLVADRLGRNAILIELNPEYAGMAEKRIHGDQPLFAQVRREAAE